MYPLGQLVRFSSYSAVIIVDLGYSAVLMALI